MTNNKVFDGLDKSMNAMIYILCIVEVIIGGVLSILLSLGVFYRYVLQSSLIFSDELSRILFIWFGLLGATIALHEGSHAGFDLIKNRLKGNAARIVGIITYTLIIIYAAVLGYGCITILPKQFRQSYPILKISHFWSYLSVVVGMGLLILRASYSLIRLIQKKEENLLSVTEMFERKEAAK